jgi:hypothetical protein
MLTPFFTFFTFSTFRPEKSEKGKRVKCAAKDRSSNPATTMFKHPLITKYKLKRVKFLKTSHPYLNRKPNSWAEAGN